jgi:hypothetical protein
MEKTHEQERRARVFISCGQKKGSEEVKIARNIQTKLVRLGFDAWFAEEVHSLRGLRENIFENLANFEYFVFVDFRREKLVGNKSHPVPDNQKYRGSLFTNQELAVASYLEMPSVIFQEQGVKDRDGMLGCLHANAIMFHDRRSLPTMIAKEVKEAKWDRHHRNELVLERGSGYSPHLQNNGETARFFHVTVHNLHRFKTATNCNVYLESASKLGQPIATPLPVNSVEFKWAGYVFPSVNIPPRNKRRFDAFFVLPSQPTRLFFRTFSDSIEFTPQIHGAGKYELGYLVISENFPPARASLILTLSEIPDHTTLESGG